MYKVGERYKNPLLGKTLKKIASFGAEEIYGRRDGTLGETGKNLIKDISEAGGILIEDDLKDYRFITNLGIFSL